MDLIADEGIDALTMTRLATELDLSVGALYRYFRSKDALIAELQARAMGTISDQLAAARQGWEASLPDEPRIAACAELLAVADHYLGLARRDPRLYRLVAATLADPRLLVDDAEASEVMPRFSTLIAEVAMLFEAAAARGAIEAGQSLERTVVYWTALHGVTLVGKLERLAPQSAEWFTARRMGLELAVTLLRGWGAQTDHVQRARDWLAERQPPEEPSASPSERPEENT
jgi:AcrR family transcriptional regulator